MLNLQTRAAPGTLNYITYWLSKCLSVLYTARIWNKNVVMAVAHFITAWSKFYLTSTTAFCSLYRHRVCENRNGEPISCIHVKIYDKNLIISTHVSCARNGYDCELWKLVPRENIPSHFEPRFLLYLFFRPGLPYFMVTSMVLCIIDVSFFAKFWGTTIPFFSCRLTAEKGNKTGLTVFQNPQHAHP